MTPAEKKLLGCLLDDYADHLGNQGCNDFMFKHCKTAKGKPLFTDEEKAELAASYALFRQRQEPDVPVTLDPTGGLDFLFLAMLREKLDARD